MTGTRREAGPLGGRRVVVTRPAGQSLALLQMLESRGAVPIAFPVLEIRDVEDLGPLVALIERLDAFDLAIFISPNAVNKAMNLVTARRSWPPHVRVAAIGQGSRKELVRHGFAEVLAPPGRSDSEALLAHLPAAAVAGRRIVIFRGDGGRELLGDALTARGASVEYAECYRRARPDADVGPLLRAWARNELDAIIVTSSEGLANLYDMVGKLAQQWLRQTPLVVPHSRIAANARGLGLTKVIETASGDEAMVAGLEAFFAKVDPS